MQTLLAVGRGILLLASFIGLCAGLRVRFGLDRMIAPFAAVSGIIAALTLSGVAGILKIGLYALYALGFAGLFYAYWLRRARPEYGLILALVGYCAFLVWRFYPCPLYLNDDISHWGLVARHLLRHDAFPDASADYVFFQSYPLGAACFIYYVCRAVANAEGLYVAAQNLLLGPLFLPLLAHVRGNRRTCYPAAAALFVFLFHYFRRMVNLEVDLPLAFFGIGLAATAAFYRDDRKRALGAALPGIVAVIYVKNSGAFFALTTLLLLVSFARRRGSGLHDGADRHRAVLPPWRGGRRISPASRAALGVAGRNRGLCRGLLLLRRAGRAAQLSARYAVFRSARGADSGA